MPLPPLPPRPTLAELLAGAPRSAPSRKDGGWYAWFGRRFVPREASRLEALSHRALALLASGEAWTLSLSMREAITAFTGGVTPEEVLEDPRYAHLLPEVMAEFDGQDENLHDLYPWRPHELLGIASARDVPGIDPATPLSEADLADLAEAIFTRAAEAEGGSTHESDAEAQWSERLLPTHRVPVRLEEDLRRRAKVAPLSVSTWPSLAHASPQERVTVIDRETAFAFCHDHHTQLPEARVQGLLVAIGLRVGGTLRGVALANTPSGRALKDEDPAQRHVIDVTRIATDDEGGRGSVHGASSLLMRWFLTHGQELVRPHADRTALVVTFSLLTETGATYQALVPEGLHAVELVPPHTPGGARVGSEAGKKEVWKIRWEAGEDARPHRPHLLQLHRAYTAVTEGRPLGSRHFRGLETREALVDLARTLGLPGTAFRNALTIPSAKALLLSRFGAPR